MPLRLNTVVYSWNSCLFKVDNSIVDKSGRPWKITELTWKQERKKKIVRANRQDGKPIGKTSGVYSVPTCTMTMLRDSALQFTDYLSDVGQGSYGDAEFTLITQISEPVRGTLPITYTLREVTVDGEEEGHEEGEDGPELVTKFELGVLSMTRKYNGRTQQMWSALRSLQNNT